jgi:hypothetical protein
MNDFTLHDDRVVLYLKVKIYPYDSIIKTAKEFSDFFLVQMDGNPENTMIVTMRPRKGENVNLEEAALDFYNHLILSIKNR